MRYMLAVLLSTAGVVVAASPLRAQAPDFTRTVPPLRPVPTLVTLRPASFDSARARGRAVEVSASRQHSRYNGVVVGVLLGGSAGGLIGHMLGKQRERDCTHLFCGLDTVGKTVQGALIGGVVGGIVGGIIGGTREK